MNDQVDPIDFVVFDNLQAIFDDAGDLLDLPEKPKKITTTDRLERSFIEIIEFVREHGHEPSATTREIAERKLGARLAGIRGNPEKVELLRDADEFGLLDEPQAPASLEDLLSLDSSDDGLGLLDDPTGLHDIASLPVETRGRTEPEEIASRSKCHDFKSFEMLFKQKHEELRAGVSKLVPFQGQATVRAGAFFVLNGVMLFVAEMSDTMAVPGIRIRHKQRTRTIYENGTESNLYDRSLASQLYEKDGFEIVPAHYEIFEENEATGWVYVLRSLSDDPQITGRENLYKIGFSTTPVEKRIANALNEPTYLMAPVEIVETYRTYNMKTSALEHLLHRVFADARLKINQTGVDGRTYNVTEWFEVPLSAIREAADLIVSGDIVDYMYDSDSMTLQPIA